jgi:hypothetical protein
MLFPRIFGTQVKSIYYWLLQVTTARKRPLLSPTNLRLGPAENTSHGLHPLLCDVTAYAEMCLPSRCLEAGRITPLLYCCVQAMQGVYWAVAWQCVDMSQYFYGRLRKNTHPICWPGAVDIRQIRRLPTAAAAFDSRSGHMWLAKWHWESFLPSYFSFPCKFSSRHVLSSMMCSLNTERVS